MTTSDPATLLEKTLKQRIITNPLDLDARRRLARTCIVNGRNQEAAEHYVQILKKQERDSEALNFLARFYLDHGSLQHADTLLRALLSIDPSNQAARYHLGALQALRENSRTLSRRLELQEKLLGEEDRSIALGLRRENIPCLIEMNGDLLWLPGDLLRFLWHTVQKPLTTPTPSFLAETPHYAWIKERISPGDDVLDIGSNIGIFATMMGAKVGRAGRVFAFEPSARIAADLRRVLALNELSQVTVVEAAASNQNGEATFCEIQEADVRRESSHLSDPLLDSASRDLKQNAMAVKTVVIDDFVAEHQIRPAVMKIDVEGAEFLVLEGAQKTIGACKPKLVIEIHANSAGIFDHGRLTAYLKRFGYEYATETKTYYCW